MDMNDVKSWAREEEITRNMQVEEITAELKDLREDLEIAQIKATKGVKLMLISVVFFSVILAIVVLLSGVLHIIPIVKGMF